MARRAVVDINYGEVTARIRKVCGSLRAFCDEMGRPDSWVNGWRTKRNLPSPEEAARMCEMLRVDPAEVIAPEDVERVRRHMSYSALQATEGTKKGGSTSSELATFLGVVSQLDEAGLRSLLDYASFLLSRKQ